MYRLWLKITSILFTLLIVSTSCYAAQVVNGILASNPTTGLVRILTEKDVLLVSTDLTTKVFLTEIGKPQKEVTLRELAAGDRIVANVKQDGLAVTIKAFNEKNHGEVIKVTKDTIILKNGNKIKINPLAQIILPDGHSGKIQDIQKGFLVILRQNPISKEAWTVVAVKQSESKEIIAKPVIKSIVYKAPEVLKAGDIITVNMTGSNNGQAFVEIKGLTKPSAMKEVSKGNYQALIRIPATSLKTPLPLVGSLTVNGIKASPMQAGKLIELNKTTVKLAPGKKPANKLKVIPPAVIKMPAPEPEPLQPISNPVQVKAEEPVITTVVVPTPLPEPPKPVEIANITLTTPADGEKIQRAIIINGNAQPESRIVLEITYSNEKIGLLEISGSVLSQLIAASKNGEFKAGPIALEGPLATKGLKFFIKAYYADFADKIPATARVYGDRN